MRLGTKIGLILIALTYVTVSTLMSIAAFKDVLRQGEQRRHVVPSSYRASTGVRV